MKIEQIDTSTTLGKVEVMRLYSEGRKVVTTNNGGEWRPISTPEWAWDSYDYAIIAEPVVPDEVFVSVHANGVFAAVHMVRPMVHQGNSIVRYVRADQ